MIEIPLKKDTLYNLVPAKGGWEIPRKLLHITQGFLVLILSRYFRINPEDVYSILAVALCILSAAELFRFQFKWFNKFYLYIFGSIMRQREVNNQVNSAIYYLAGCLIVLYVFPKDISLLSIIYLSWTDPTASICGKLWGKYTPKYGGGKSVAGSLGAAVIGALVTFVYFSLSDQLSYYTSTVPLWVLTIYGGLVASVSEGVSDLVFGLDDNLTIPVISATLLWLPLVGLRLE